MSVPFLQGVVLTLAVVNVALAAFTLYWWLKVRRHD